MPEKHHEHTDSRQKKAIIDRLNRIEGQVRGIGKMVDTDVYCEDILNQLGSVKSALNGVIMVLFESHARHCILPAAEADADTSLRELNRLVKRLIG